MLKKFISFLVLICGMLALSVSGLAGEIVVSNGNSPVAWTQTHGYAALGGSMQQLLGQTAFFTSAHAGWRLNQQAYVGFGVYSLTAPRYPLPSIQPTTDLIMFYGGVEAGYLFPLRPKVSLRTQILLGITSMDYIDQGQYAAQGVVSNDTLVLEPGVYADFRLWKELVASIGLHYHFTQGAEGPEGLRSSDLNQPGVEMIIGWSGF